MKILLILLIVPIIFSCGRQNGSVVKLNTVIDSVKIKQYLEEYRPGITEAEHSVDQVLEIVDLFHKATPYKHDPRLLTFTPSENVYHALFDDTYSVMCGGFAMLVFDSMKMLGYEVRLVQLFSEGINNHVATEVFVEGGWLAVDTMLNAVFTDHDGNLLSFEEMKELYATTGDFLPEYIDGTRMSIDDYFNDHFIDYKDYMFNIRALPEGFKGMPYLDTVVEGEERY